MKKISISFMGLALLAILLVAPAAHATAALLADIRYTETVLGEGLWQYDFTVENMSSMDDSHPYLWKVDLEFENHAYVILLNNPTNWSAGTFDGYLPDTTDYVTMYSDASAFDVFPGGLLTGLSFTADYQLGVIDYVAWFSDHGTIPDELSVFFEGTASPVPVPAAVWLLGSGLIGLAGLRRKMVG